MRAQPHNPDPINNNRVDTRVDSPAPAEHEQESPGSTPSRQPRRRVGAARAVRHVVVRGVRRDPPDIHKLARVVASLAADIVATESGERPPTVEPDTADASDREHRRDAA